MLEIKRNIIELLIVWVLVMVCSIYRLPIYFEFVPVLMVLYFMFKRKFGVILYLILPLFLPFTAIRIPNIYLMFSIVAMIISLFRYKHRIIYVLKQRVFLYVGFIFLLMYFSLSFVSNVEYSIKYLSSFFFSILYLFIFLINLYHFTNKEIQTILIVIAFIGSIYFVQGVVFSNHYNNNNLHFRQIELGVDETQLEAKSQIDYLIEYKRLILPGDEPNYRGVLLLGTFSISLGLLLSRYNIMFLLMLIGNLISIFGTFSRSSIISLIITTVLASLFTKKKKFLKYLVPLVVLFYILLILNPNVVDRLLTIPENIEQHGGSGRFSIYTESLSLWMKKPLFGIGVGELNYKIGAAHNTYIQILTELGVVGFALFAFIISSAISFKNFCKNKLYQIVFIGLLGIMFNINTVSMFNYSIIFLFISLLTVLKNKRNIQQDFY